jgi:predicted dinucleotide-binding enzyme
LVGGTGKIGTAVANHLLLRQRDARIVLVGRNTQKGTAAVNEVRHTHPNASVQFVCGNFDQQRSIHATAGSASLAAGGNDDDVMTNLIRGHDCVIHTAGPYADCRPVTLQAAIEVGVQVYVDVADPLPYLEQGVLLSDAAKDAGTTAVLAAGAFPGMSNVLGMETAAAAMELSGRDRIKDLCFNYFTAGLGGSGNINLYITNIGFGDAMGVYQSGELTFFSTLSGLLLGSVDFFLPTSSSSAGFGNAVAKERVGTKQVFAWPFPEAATVASFLKIRGSSSAAMGTAPDLWNSMLGLLVNLIPRQWWRKTKFSKFMADFSEPLVWATDQWLKTVDSQGVGETHAMRIDVKSVDDKHTVSTVQAHDSFRQCVGQSCAEFALDCLDFPDPGVYLPEQRYQNTKARKRIINKLTSTPGTFCYTGPVETDNNTPQPTGLQSAFNKAAKAGKVR